MARQDKKNKVSKGFLKLAEAVLGIDCTVLPHTHTRTHNKMSQYLNLEGTLLRLRAEVFPSLDGEAHLEVFSEEWTQIHTGSRNRV